MVHTDVVCLGILDADVGFVLLELGGDSLGSAIKDFNSFGAKFQSKMIILNESENKIKMQCIKSHWHR